MMRVNYWTCSKFADWLRGEPKGGAKTAGQWKEWREKAKRERPVRYWLAEEGLGYLQDLVMYPYDTYRRIRRYVKNRWIDKSDALVAKPHHIAPGTWCDLTERFLYCPFDALVDFVEVECAHMQQMAAKVKSRRSRHDGLAYLEWAIQLGAEHADQSAGAREIKELYLWWVDERPNRKDPWEKVGLDNFYQTIEEKYGSMFGMTAEMTEKEQQERDKLHKLHREVEAEQQQEDDAMLIRLIKIRHQLWT